MDYYQKKAKHAYELYLKGEPFRKVYAAVEKDGKFVVLKNDNPNKKAKYQFSLSGGGVDEGEDNVTAIKREVKEELNMNVEVVRSLGCVKYNQTWIYEGKEYNLDYLSEIFLVRFDSYSDNVALGLPGEFQHGITIEEISKDELLENVFEFKDGGIKF